METEAPQTPEKEEKIAETIPAADTSLPGPGPMPVRPVVWVNIVLFACILFAGGILSIVLPKKDVSEIEKRKLSQMPVFTWDSVFHGRYTQKLEDYYADNFPYRDNLVSISSGTKERLGYRVNGVMVYNLDKPTETQKKSSAKNIDSILNAKDSVTSEDADDLENDAEIVKNVMIYKGRAIQIFGGSKNSAHSYASLINKYHEVLGPSVKIYHLTIPTPIDFYLPDKYKHVSDGERKNIEAINEALDTGIVKVDAWSQEKAHENEYLYYYTDHHWTGRGAYYAYRAFCQAAHLAPYELNNFQRKVIPHFLGSLYDLTRDSRVKDNMDSVEYFKLPITTKTTIYSNKSNLNKGFKGSLFAESARGGNSYSVFLGGDFPLVKIESGLTNGRRLLVIKDSYGNALAPYFALHFQEVYVVDYRYFDANLVNFIRDKKITDMIFMHNTFVANSKYTTQRESFLMRMKAGTGAPGKSAKKDSTAARKPVSDVKKDTVKTNK